MIYKSEERRGVLSFEESEYVLKKIEREIRDIQNNRPDEYKNNYYRALQLVRDTIYKRIKHRYEKKIYDNKTQN